MLDFGLFREIFQSLNKNKLRTLLSGFTVAFAIMLFTILFGIANGFQNTFNNEFNGDANNSIFIYSGRTSKAVEGYQTGRRIQFDNPLYNTLKNEVLNFNTDLAIKPKIICRTKADLGNELSEEWNKFEDDIIEISSFSGLGLNDLISTLSSVIKK